MSASDEQPPSPEPPSALPREPALPRQPSEGSSHELLDSESRFRHLIHRDADAVLVLSVDGVVRFANPAAEALFSRSNADLAGRLFGVPVMGGETSELSILREDGTTAIAELYVVETAWGGEAVYLTFLRNVTSRAKAENALRDSEERYALAARAANDGLWDWNFITGHVYYSPRWKSMLGWGADDIPPESEEWFRRVHPEDLERMRAALGAHISALSSHFECEYRMQHKNGSYRWILCRGLAVRDPQGKATRMAGSQTDVTHRKLAEEQLAHRAFYDALTNLPNRALFIDRLRHAVRRSGRRKDHLFAVLFLDIDRFKVINDSLGHMAGDRLLVMIARRLELSLRPGDSVARLGGDEFTVLLDDIRDVNDATRVAERIQRELSMPFNVGGQELYTSASIGIALSITGYERPEDILRDADTAMYRAKALGKARHAMFDMGMHERAVVMLQTEADLRRALERSELCVHYQPILALDTGRIEGVEALARWQHPTRGLISPADFIPLAEETGMIVPIGRFVAREACRQVVAWQKAGNHDGSLSVSVNLSGRQLALPEYVREIGEVLEETGLDPRRLRLEMTESLIMEKPEAVAGTLRELRRLGVQIAIDDFGTGYSSLAYLQRFPIDTLKIDRSFVAPIGSKGERAEIARTIVDIGHNLGMSVIAEGVETADQLAQMRQLGCDGAQGYFIARPLHAVAAGELFASGQTW